jgi:transcriptional regulator with XRE-family HTH domain
MGDEMDKISKQFGNKIAQLRSKLGMTQEELAECTGLSQNFISRLESGNKNASLETVYQIAGALKISPFELFNFPSFTKDKNLYLKKLELILNTMDKRQQKTFVEMARDIASKLKKH